ncbi:hypothetical protein [Burkholderia multivorans]|uniref:hypothetical protein n=1 Tax=Burkholderia multivorans TaxID=87883 RepID=UPI001C223513|nr:hypothetical protein [Burkholderia multivorans]
MDDRKYPVRPRHSLFISRSPLAGMLLCELRPAVPFASIGAVLAIAAPLTSSIVKFPRNHDV